MYRITTPQKIYLKKALLIELMRKGVYGQSGFFFNIVSPLYREISLIKIYCRFQRQKNFGMILHPTILELSPYGITKKIRTFDEFHPWIPSKALILVKNYFDARFKYVPSAVLISSSSSTSTKSGTLTTRPVSIVAGLPEPVTVAPLIEGCVSTTRNTTVVGN